MAHKRNSVEVPELEKLLAGKKKKYVRYEEGAVLYSMGKNSFRQVAQDAHAIVRLKRIALVNVYSAGLHSLIGDAYHQRTGSGRHDTDSDASTVPFSKRSGTAFADDWQSSAADKSKTENRGHFADHDGQPHHLWQAD